MISENKLSRTELYGQKISSLTNLWISILKKFIFLKYNLFEETKIELKATEFPIINRLSLLKNQNGNSVNDGLVVGTVRMGYGHHRMAYALYTWAIAKGNNAFLHDILALDCKESTAIKEIDGLYSQMSKWSSEIGGFVEWIWGQITSSGNIASLEISLQLAERYKNLLNGVPKHIPYLSTYPLNGQIAVAYGIKKVIHLIPDNYPQYFLLTPGAINLVQSPASYMKFIEMGVPKESLQIAGHWVSHKLANEAISNSELRIQRAEKKLKRRFLIPIGGAGAQKSYLISLLDSLSSKIKDKKLKLWVNTGDHKNLFEDLKVFLTSKQIPFHIIYGREELLGFCEKRKLNNFQEEEENSLVLFHFSNHFEAFSATDILMEIADVLVTKPSELAFFPIPKIFIRRVGDHEAASAFRSMELGEGTMECRESEHAVEMIRFFSETDGIFIRMNECIIRNSREGIYDGAKFAVDLATSKT